MRTRHLLPLVGVVALVLSWAPVGCVPSGGFPLEGTGGTKTGGTTGAGGAQSTGGTTTATTSTGGTHASGGTTSTGGTRASGGTTAEGGTSGAGGTTMTTREDASVPRPDLAPTAPDTVRRDGGEDARDSATVKRDSALSTPDLKPAGRGG